MLFDCQRVIGYRACHKAPSQAMQSDMHTHFQRDKPNRDEIPSLAHLNNDTDQIRY